MIDTRLMNRYHFFVLEQARAWADAFRLTFPDPDLRRFVFEAGFIDRT